MSLTAMMSAMIFVSCAEVLARIIYEDPGILGYMNTDDVDLSFVHRGGAHASAVRPEYAVEYFTEPRFGLRAASTAPLDDRPVDAILFGDSYVFGQGVQHEDTLSAQLAKKLNRHVLNAGVANYGPDQAFVMAQRLRKAYRPKVEIACFTEINDFWDLDRFEILDYSGDEIRTRPAKTDTKSLRHYVTHLPFHTTLSKSYFYAWGRNRYAVWRHQEMFAAVKSAGTQRADLSELNHTRLQCLVRMYREWQDTVGAEHFLLVIIPRPSSHTGLTPLMAKFLEQLSGAGINVLDLGDPLPRSADEILAYEANFFPIDQHWTPAGHTWAAERVSPRIRELLR